MQAILLLDDLGAGVDELEAAVIRWGETVEDLAAPFVATTEHVRITFLTPTGEPLAGDTFRLTGFSVEPGEAPVRVDEILERRPLLETPEIDWSPL